jgi:hypothetical protein
LVLGGGRVLCGEHEFDIFVEKFLRAPKNCIGHAGNRNMQRFWGPQKFFKKGQIRVLHIEKPSSTTNHLNISLLHDAKTI